MHMNQEMKHAFEGIKTHIDTQISHVREDIVSLENRMTTKMVELADFMMESLENTKVELRGEIKESANTLRTELKGDISDLRTELKGDILDTKIELKKEIASSAFLIRESTVSKHDFSLLTKRVEVLEG